MERKSYSLVLALFALVVLQGCSRTPQSNVNTEVPNSNSENDESGPVAVVGGGAAEPNYRYPWVVSLRTGCFGVVIHPRWVLTAAHCISPVIGSNIVEYSRTDPYTGTVQTESRGPALTNGVIKHPNFDPATPPPNDLALIKLATSFPITPYLQTAAIPSTPTVAGPVGTVAASSHTTMLPPDKYAIFRAGITPQTFGNSFLLGTTVASGSLCPGDSGSAFITYESGRATIRGIVSQASGDCVNPAGHVTSFTDVFAHRDWIFQTIGMTDYFLAGNTRVRWSGRATRGQMGLGCQNEYGTMWGPIDVPGVELGANCEKEQTQTIVCSLSGNGSGPIPLGITSFRMKTVCAPHSSTDEALPISSSTWASYFGQMPANPDPLGFCQREFRCQIGLLMPARQAQVR